MSTVELVNSNNNYNKMHIIEATETAFLEYSSAVIRGRALPDVRDGCKPVHRRAIYAQHQLGNFSSKPYKKSARIVGDIIGKYHPHGDTAVYDTLVRMAQSFSMCAPLADGQGNFGSRDGDSQAAMRYTEIRMSKISEAMLKDINLNTVDFEPNYDNSETMPSVLPTRFPNLIINGSDGIAVGMACKIPSHNPIEAMNVVIAMLKAELNKEDLSVEELIEIMPAPDYPTGGLIHGLENYKDAWEYGRCKFRIRSQWDEEVIEGRNCIVLKEIPYNVNKAKLIESISEKITYDDTGEAEIEGVYKVEDESSSEDMNGVRIVVALKSDANAEIVFNELCRKTKVEESFYYNVNVIIKGRPRRIGLKQAFNEFIEFRKEVVLRRCIHNLDRKNKRMHTLEGVMRAVNNLDEAIETIRSSKSTAEANEALQELLKIDEEQASDILAMRLQTLASSALLDLKNEFDKVSDEINELKMLIDNEDKRIELIIRESEEEIDTFLNFRDPRHGAKLLKKRRCDYSIDLISITKEDLIPREECSVIGTSNGFIRRIPNSEIRSQNRGSVGSSKIKLAKEDFISQTLHCNSHDVIAFVTNHGRIAFRKCYEVETSIRGIHVNNLIVLENGEKVIKFTRLKESTIANASKISLVIGTKFGMVKAVPLSLYNPNRKLSVRTINLKDDDEVVFIGFGEESSEVCMVSSNTKMIRFQLDALRETGRTSMGVIGIRMEEGETVQCGAIVSNDGIEKSRIGIVTTGGQLKVSALDGYRKQNRGGKGLLATKLKEGDKILGAFILNEDEEFDIVTSTRKGIVNRIDATQFRVTGRRTSGVRLVAVESEDYLVSAVLTPKDDEVEAEEVLIEDLGHEIEELDHDIEEMDTEELSDEDDSEEE